MKKNLFRNPVLRVAQRTLSVNASELTYEVVCM